jgi:hypothetical protein
MIVVAGTVAIAGCAPTVTEDALDPGVTRVLVTAVAPCSDAAEARG